MRLVDIIEAANRHYPDGFIADLFDEVREEVLEQVRGDTLALFVARELSETFDPTQADLAQVDEAIRVLRQAQSDLGAALRGLQELRARYQCRDSA